MMRNTKNKSHERGINNHGIQKVGKTNHRSTDTRTTSRRQSASFNANGSGVGARVHVKSASGMYELGSLRARSVPAALVQECVQGDKGQEHKNNTVTVVLEQSGKALDVPTDDVFMANGNVEDDMCKLIYVNEPALLHNIQLRSLDDSPYTFVGPVLVAVNPLRDVPEPVNFRKIRRRIRPRGSVSTSHSKSKTTWPAIPHPATIAEYRYQAMVLALSQRRALLHSRGTRWNRDKQEGKVNSDSRNHNMVIADQSIVVGGESGSGKTESSRMVLKHLVERCGGDKVLHCRLLASAPILEAFGNARTLRNRNSSRFAKFLKLHFDDMGTSICGATVETYLLERSRVTSHETGESNFHIFTLLCNDNTEMNANEFAFLCEIDKPPPNTLTVINTKNGIARSRRRNSPFQNSHKANWKQSVGGDARELSITLDTVRKSLDQFGIRKSTQDNLFEILRGLLHLGNVSFGEEERAAGDVAVVRYEAQESLVAASEAFGVNKQDLSNALCQRVVRMGSETTIMFRSALSAQFARDALAKAVYVRVFKWLVVRINQAMQDELLRVQQTYENQEKSQCEKSQREGETDKERRRRLRKAKRHALSISIDSDTSVENAAAFVGVLDIMGIESLLRNDFEQLLINGTNTVLQATFIKQVLRAEDELYRLEGLTSLSLDFSSTFPNTEMIDMEKLGGGPTNDKCMLLLQGPSNHGVGSRTSKKIDKLTQRGILKVIEEESRMPNSTDKQMLNRLNAMYTGKNAGKAGECFGSVHPRDRDSMFIVIHYAGAVAYRVGNFLLKNHDSLPDEVANIIEFGSTNELLKVIWSIGNNTDNNRNGADTKRLKRRHRASTTSVSGSMRKQTVIGAYVPQLNELVSTLEATACSFIRCIKPNSRMTRVISSPSVARLSIDDSQPEDHQDAWFDAEYVMLQLRHLNVTDTTEVLRRGFPTRLSYDTLCELFVPCLPNEVLKVWRSLGGEAPQAFVAALLHAFRISPEDFKLGVTKAFFKTGCLASLTHILQSADTWQQQPGDEAEEGSMSSGSEQVVSRFRAYFARRLWRVTFAKIVAQDSFRQLLLEVRKNSKQDLLMLNKQASLVQAAWRNHRWKKQRAHQEKEKTMREDKLRAKQSEIASDDEIELIENNKDSNQENNSQHNKDSKDHEDVKHKNGKDSTDDKTIKYQATKKKSPSGRVRLSETRNKDKRKQSVIASENEIDSIKHSKDLHKSKDFKHNRYSKDKDVQHISDSKVCKDLKDEDIETKDLNHTKDRKRTNNTKHTKDTKGNKDLKNQDTRANKDLKQRKVSKEQHACEVLKARDTNGNKVSKNNKDSQDHNDSKAYENLEAQDAKTNKALNNHNKDSKDQNDSKTYEDLKSEDTSQTSQNRSFVRLSHRPKSKQAKHDSVVIDAERAISRLLKLALAEQQNVEHSSTRDSRSSSTRIESSKHDSRNLMRRFDQHRRAFSQRKPAKLPSNWEKRQQLMREEEIRNRHARFGHKGPTPLLVAASLVKQAEIDEEVLRLSGESAFESDKSADAKDKIIAWGWKLSMKSRRNWKRRLFVLSKLDRSVSYFTKTKDWYGLQLKGVFSLGDKSTVFPRTEVPRQHKLVKMVGTADELCVAEMIGGRSAKGNGKLRPKILSMFIAFDSHHTLKSWARAVHISVHGSAPKCLFPRGTFSDEETRIYGNHIPQTSGSGYVKPNESIHDKDIPDTSGLGYAKPNGCVEGIHIPETSRVKPGGSDRGRQISETVGSWYAKCNESLDFSRSGSQLDRLELPMSKGSIADLVIRVDELEDQLLDGDIDDATFEKRAEKAFRGVRVAEAKAREQWQKRKYGGEDESNFVAVPGTCDTCGEVVFADKSGRGSCEACGSEFELDFIITSRRDLLPTVRTSVRHGHMRMQVNQAAHESGLLLQEIK